MKEENATLNDSEDIKNKAWSSYSKNGWPAREVPDKREVFFAGWDAAVKALESLPSEEGEK